MNWISVDDRLPKTTNQFEMFIVSTDKGVGVARYGEYDGFNAVYLSGNVQHSTHQITHWMPLPEKP